MQKQEVDRMSAASLKRSPSPGLQEMYQVLAGNEGHIRELRDLVRQSLTNEELTIAVLSASIFNSVFSSRANHTLAFPAFQQRQHASLATALPILDAQLQPLHTNLDTLLRRTHLSWLRDSRTREGEVSDNAGLLTYPIASLLLAQSNPTREHVDARMMQRMKSLADPIKD